MRPRFSILLALSLIQLLSLSLVITVSPLPAFAAETGAANKLEEAIIREKIFGADAKVRVAVDGSEAIVTTYRIASASDDDCKIDAVLAGKCIFAAEPGVSRVMVRFYDPRVGSGYGEVRVTVGDVKAFATGTISKEQLLTALVLSSQSGPSAPSQKESSSLPSSAGSATADGSSASAGPRATSNSGSSTSAGLSSSSSSSESPASATGSAAAAAPGTAKSGIATYSNYGLVLNYPGQWSAVFPKGSNTVLRCFIKGSSKQDSVLELKVYPGGQLTARTASVIDPEKLFGAAWKTVWMQSMASDMGASGGLMAMMMAHGAEEHHHRGAGEHHHHGRREESDWRRGHVSLAGVQLPLELKLGRGKSIAGAQRAYWASSPMSPREYMRAVSFGSSPYVFQLLLLCSEADASNANAAFEQVLSSLTVSAKAPAKSTAAKGKNRN